MRCLRLLLLLAAWAAASSAALTTTDPAPLGSRVPVVLIHGWNSSAAVWDPLLERAREYPDLTRRCKLYRFGYDWRRPLSTSATALRADLDAENELARRPVMLVGHSMGGLVARTYGESTQPGWDGLGRVGALLTLDTPHHGSPMANLEWVGGQSRYSLLVSIVPGWLLQPVLNLGVFQALRTEGGQDLGWDNFDGRMPDEIWALASRTTRLLNTQLAQHPQRDELLLRYRLHASYLETVASLNVVSLQAALRRGDNYAAGAALLAHAFRNGEGQQIGVWGANDGVVPLESSCFLAAGPPVFTATNGRVTVREEVIQQRSLRPGLVASVLAGVDHSAIVHDPASIDEILGAAVAADFNALVLAGANGALVWRPRGGPAAPLPAVPSQAIPLASPAGDELVVAQMDSLWRVTPKGAEVVARSGVHGSWQIAPDGAHAVAPDGALVGVREPAYLRLEPSPAPAAVVWSPDGQRVAWRGADGALRLADAERLTAVQPPAGADLAPLAWSPNGNQLMAAEARAEHGPASAWYRPDGLAVALMRAEGLPVRGRWIDQTGASQGTWAVPAGPAALVLLRSGEAAAEPLAEAAASPVWLADGESLAWVDSANGALGLRRGGRVQRVAVPQGRLAGLAAASDGALLGAVQAGRGAALVRWTPRGLDEVARADAGPAGSPVPSPDGRHAALPLADGTVLVAEVEGPERVRLAGRGPLWLPQPAARRWLPARAPRG